MIIFYYILKIFLFLEKKYFLKNFPNIDVDNQGFQKKVQKTEKNYLYIQTFKKKKERNFLSFFIQN